jgi:DNA-binding NarL/FixJ family response regulator
MNATAPPPCPLTTTRVVVVDDHVMVREGLVALINREKDLEVCGEAESVQQALTLIDTTLPQVVIVDLVLHEGNGIDLVKEAKTRHPGMHFLVISMQDEEIYAERCIRAGASGYVMKHSATDTFLDAIRAILTGEIYDSHHMNVRLLRKMTGTNRDDGRQLLAQLTDREFQVFQMIGGGIPPRDIAARLGISRKTVATHRENLKIKLGVKDTPSLMQFAMQWLDNHQ